MIDLHCHSVYSDGSLTPAELAEEAVRAGLSAVSLTDHDTTVGLIPFAAAAQGRFRVVPGVEISTDYNPGTMHMLGYFIDPLAPGFEAKLFSMREGRRVRNIEMVQRLNGLGCPLTLEEVEAFAHDEVVARPHFAQALVACGFVRNKDEAFAKYLMKGKPGYVYRFKFSPEDSIRLIHEAGGVAVLAHPCSLGLNMRPLRKLVERLCAAGLGGIEAWYSLHAVSQTQAYRKMADELGLVSTGGSDFHGTAKPALRLGCGFGHLQVPDEVVANLEARRASPPPDPKDHGLHG